MNYRIVSLQSPDAWEQRLTIAEIYQYAFDATPELALGFMENSLVNVLEYDGATLLVATAGDQPVGFLYGYTFQAGHWWPEHITSSLVVAGHSHYMERAFELVELAVLPSHQNRGIGSALLQHQMENQPQDHVLLATSADPQNGAIALYQRHGFEILVPDFRYSPQGDSTLIMGALV